MRNIIAQKNEINKYICENNFEFLTSVPRKHIAGMVLSYTRKGSSGKTCEYSEYTGTYRTSVGHFLSKGKWDSERLNTVQKRRIFKETETVSLKSGKPIYISLDDTVCTKTEHQKGAKRPMEEAGWHFSHKDNKMVYGYQFFGAHIASDDAKLCYSLERYRKDTRTKVEMAKDIIDSLPETDARVIAMCDSWYTCAGLVNLCTERKITMIGALKTNRVIFHEGRRTKITDYAKTLSIEDFHPIKYNGHDYLVCRYTGKLNGINNAVVLITYPVGSFGKQGALSAFLCSDTSLSDEEILFHYAHRWNIETMFKKQKRYFGLKSFMFRSARAIDRLLIVIVFAGLLFHALSDVLCFW